MNKHCSKCASSTGTLHPHCTQYDQPIKLDADWHLTPVRECLAHQEMIDMRKQYENERCRKSVDADLPKRKQQGFVARLIELSDDARKMMKEQIQST